MAALMVTDMRFFSGMCPGMNSQRTALDEALIAVLDGAMIRSLIGMYSIMSTEIRFAIERLLPSASKILNSLTGANLPSHSAPRNS